LWLSSSPEADNSAEGRIETDLTMAALLTSTTVGKPIVRAPLKHDAKDYTQDCLISQKFAAAAGKLSMDDWAVAQEDEDNDSRKEMAAMPEMSEKAETDQLMSKDAEDRFARFLEVDSQCLETLNAGFNQNGETPCDTEPHWQEMMLGDGTQEQVAALRCVAFLGMPGSDPDRVGRGLMMITKAKEAAPDGSKHLLNWVLLDNSSSFDASEKWGEQKCCCIPMSQSINARHVSTHKQQLTWNMMFLDQSVGTASLSACDKATLLSTMGKAPKSGGCCKCCTCCTCCTCCRCCTCCSWAACWGTGGNWGKRAGLVRKLDELIEEVKVTSKPVEATMPEMQPKQVIMSQEMTSNKYRIVTGKLMHMGEWHSFTAVANPIESPHDVYKFTRALSMHRRQVESPPKVVVGSSPVRVMEPASRGGHLPCYLPCCCCCF